MFNYILWNVCSHSFSNLIFFFIFSIKYGFIDHICINKRLFLTLSNKVENCLCVKFVRLPALTRVKFLELTCNSYNFLRFIIACSVIKMKGVPILLLLLLLLISFLLLFFFPMLSPYISIFNSPYLLLKPFIKKLLT